MNGGSLERVGMRTPEQEPRAGRTSDAVRSGVGGVLAIVAEDLAAIELGLMQIVESVREHKKRKAEGDPLSVVKREKARKERNLRALELRRSGKTYREVGKIMGVGGQRAAQMCRSAEWRERQWGGGGAELGANNGTCEAQSGARSHTQ